MWLPYASPSLPKPGSGHPSVLFFLTVSSHPGLVVFERNCYCIPTDSNTKKKSYLIDKMIKGEDARDNLQKYTKYQLPVTCTSLLKNENSTHLTSTQYVLLSDFYFEVLQNIHYLLFDLLSVFYIKTVIYSYSGANLQIK